MTSAYLICCNGAPAKGKGLRGHERHDLTQFGRTPNVAIRSVGPQIFENLSSPARDLINVASFVYAADRLITRGTHKDLGDRWRRKLRFHVPVENPGIWKKAGVTHLLTDMLAFVSGDHYEFVFSRVLRRVHEQGCLTLNQPEFKNADSVGLFSGGMDSLAGVLDDIRSRQRTPILLSHWPHPRTKSRQHRLVEELRQRVNLPLPHVQAHVNLLGDQDKEYTQRTRSFLYLSLASAVAAQLGIQSVRVYENGVVGLNLPIWQQSIGGMDTRTTHPKFLALFRSLASQILGSNICISNDLFSMTRAEVTGLIAKHGMADLIQLSTSCSRVRFMSEAEPQCGVCSQCIDRRFALATTNLAQHDTQYRNDIFTEEISAIEKKKGWQTSHVRAMAIGYARAAADLREMDLLTFMENYPEVYDAAPNLGMTEEDAIQLMHQVQCRHADGVMKVLKGLVAANAGGFAAGTVEPDSLAAIICAQEHRADPIQNYANRIAAKFAQALPVMFQSQPPLDERQVQNAGQAILQNEAEPLEREFPQLSFAAVVGTKPDFATRDHKVFIEFKYPRPKTRTVKAIVTEMNAKIIEYRANGAACLFIVYDHHRMIRDRDRFCAQYAQYEGVFVRVVV